MTLHHVAFATRDVEATIAFYEGLLGFPLVHVESEQHGPTTWMRHLFFDTGADADGNHGAIAFFAFEGVGERPDWRTDLADSVGVPVWVNHCAFRADADRQDEVRRRMADAGVEPLMEVDHGWCHSVYYLDPNGIMVELCRDTPGFTADPAEARRRLGPAPRPGQG